MHASTGILFNHESPLRSERFVTQKIASAAARIAACSDEALRLGHTDIQRDRGWASEYVEAVWSIPQTEQPRGFVIATGRSIAHEEFVAVAFGHFERDWHAHVHHDPALIRPSDIRSGAADPSNAKKLLGWSARLSAEEVVARMCHAVSDGSKPSDRTAEGWSH